jgi:flagellar biosynthesis/type III secretory pathway M-ring protein FliF/YscJ
MEKNHNISALITLLAGAIAALCCLINRVPILNTLQSVLIVLIIFLVIGRIIEHIIFKINKNAYMAAVQAEEEARQVAAAAEQEEAMAAMENMGDGEEVTDDENEEET